MGTVEKYKTKTLAQKAVEAPLLKLNSEIPQQRMAVVAFGAICDRDLGEEMPEACSAASVWGNAESPTWLPVLAAWLWHYVHNRRGEQYAARFGALAKALECVDCRHPASGAPKYLPNTEQK
ncbi:MAG: hypothetical protein KGO02_01755 [Alphaproteobacteria bacterium]|nr:hypothetical protein [Alphaproteobacteria bacterium]